MWPRTIDWKQIRFGVEIEFVGGHPQEVELLPGWEMSLDEKQIDETGAESGSELKAPPLVWEERVQIREMLSRLQLQGAAVNWSCGLHVHVDLNTWGQAIVLPMIDAALSVQNALKLLLCTSEHRRIFCPPVTEEMRRRFSLEPGPAALRNHGRPQSHRCGINTAAWFDIGTVEIRYANGSLNYDEIIRTVELCLRFVAAVGEGRKLPADPHKLAIELGAPTDGYPPDAPAPQWYKERMWLEEALIPIFAPIAAQLVQQGEIHHILPVPEGILVAVERPDEELSRYIFRPSVTGWKLLDIAL
ncbi:amidoligase family protein [Paenibacillus sp. sptzw28]|uniref:amidoligase family protein n=1 Tax=Paenibacillus sp. sptzw28 TaxID=715179 RepID=UPI001C6E7A26|nr:amidoligase family protein [Paenibacillus sp. sptzw28]QYR20754.1 amidoligase family protein [Paenibacillus sp. sptzw28]